VHAISIQKPQDGFHSVQRFLDARRGEIRTLAGRFENLDAGSTALYNACQTDIALRKHVCSHTAFENGHKPPALTDGPVISALREPAESSVEEIPGFLGVFASMSLLG